MGVISEALLRAQPRSGCRSREGGNPGYLLRKTGLPLSRAFAGVTNGQTPEDTLQLLGQPLIGLPRCETSGFLL